MKTYLFSLLCGIVVVIPNANADIVLNEVLASTSGADTEFIELFNSGVSAVDVSGWEIRQYESDAGANFGSLDETNLIPGPAGTHVINPGAWFLLGNDAFAIAYGITPDVQFSNTELSIENSSVTLELYDTVNSLSIYTAYLTDGGAGDMPNIAGVVITPDIAIGPDGTFFPAGYHLNGDAGITASLLEFAPVPAPSASPGATNPVPEPSSLSLLVLAGLGVIRLRRRS